MGSQQKSSEKFSEGFSQRLRSRMARLGIQANEIAEKVGVEPGAVSNWTTGVNEAKGKNLRKLADILSCTPEWLATGEGGTLLKETPVYGYGSKEVHEPEFHIGLNLLLEKLAPQQLSQLIREINGHQRIQHAWRSFWIRVLSDWLEIKLASETGAQGTPSKSSSKKSVSAAAKKQLYDLGVNYLHGGVAAAGAPEQPPQSSPPPPGDPSNSKASPAQKPSLKKPTS